jgi:hypothetical protein
MSMCQMFVRLMPCALFLAARAAIAGPGCEMISGFDQYLSRVRGVIVADMHGTVEAPAFVGALVCNLVHSGHAVLLGLEYPSAEQHFIEEYLHARTDNPRHALLSTPFWIRPMQDGRTSRGMLDLLYSVRQEIRGGAQIRVVAFDSLPAPAQSGTSAFNERDKAMADCLRRELSNLGADEIPVIFTGNVHARKTKGLQALNAPPGMENAEPLGYRLKDLGYLHMNIDYRGGSAWVCPSSSSCGVREVGEPGAGVSSFSIVPSADPAYDVQYSVGALTASPPAATAK